MRVKVFKLNEMTKGWFVGAFSPTAFQTQSAEVAVKAYKAGEHEDRHHHKVATELTLVLNGAVRMNGCDYGHGDIVCVEPMEATDFQALTDVTTVVVKVPCVAGDKYPGDGGSV
jgi:anti-sigma factor ChrR (cupin superfamily)